MKTIGLIGGMSWESSLEYYRILNELVKEKLGGLHSAKCLMYSVDFEEIERLMSQNNWDEISQKMVNFAQILEKAGADMILICTNTVHKVAMAVEKGIAIPLLHIADATAEKIKDKGFKKVGLLGTKFTMEEHFYKGRLQETHDIEVLVPNPEDRQILNDIIFKELCLGELKESSNGKSVNMIEKLIKKGAEGIILGCTELPLLIKKEDVKIRLFNTMEIHARFAIDFAINETD